MDQNIGRIWGAIARVSSFLGLPPPEMVDSLEFDTAGGDDAPREVVETLDEGMWKDGWWDIAERNPIHPGRIGGPINFWAVVVHTTDMHPDRFGSLCRVWPKEKGRGAGAHFGLDRTPDEMGLVQFAPVTKNANHAGGPQHGWLLDGKGKRIHPNAGAVGIEVSCGGPVYLFGDKWYMTNKVNGKRLPFGAPIPANEVETASNSGRGYHKPSPWQLWMLHRLFDALADSPHRVAPPLGWAHSPNGEKPGYAPLVSFSGDDRKDIPAMPIFGHVTLDPNRKGDPWPPLSKELTERYGRTAGVR